MEAFASCVSACSFSSGKPGHGEIYLIPVTSAPVCAGVWGLLGVLWHVGPEQGARVLHNLWCAISDQVAAAVIPKKARMARIWPWRPRPLPRQV